MNLAVVKKVFLSLALAIFETKLSYNPIGFWLDNQYV